MPKPIVQATELLLQERMPRDVALARPPPEQIDGGDQNPTASFPKFSAATRSPHSRDAAHAASFEWTLFRDDDRRRLRLQPLARYRRHALARGLTCDGWGSYIFLRDVRTGESGRPATSPPVPNPILMR